MIHGGTYLHGCLRRPPERSYYTHWMVCMACLPDFVPDCQLCHTPSPVSYERDGFRAYEWGKLCPRCVERVRSGGHWEARRATASAARAEALLARWPELVSTLRARTTHVEGVIAGRRVHVKLRLAARQYESERFVFLVEYRGPAAAICLAELAFEPRIAALVARDSLKVTHHGARWLRVAFAHLGKLDTVLVLERLLATAARFETTG